MNESVMYRNISDYLEVIDNYPDIIAVYGNPIFISHVYYPIAFLEFDMYEKQFEDFKPIENIILKCYREGISDIEEIAKFLGLSKRYIGIHVHNLINKAQIINGKVSDIGLQSLQENKLIQEFTNSKQIFQADAVFGLLMSKEFYQSKNRLIEPWKTNRKYLHIKNKEEISFEKLEKQLLGKDTLNKYRRKVINNNVISINNVSFEALYYVPVFMIWFERHSHPMIFFHTFQKERKDDINITLHSFKPLFISASIKNIFNHPGLMVIDDRELNGLFINWQKYINDAIPNVEEIEGLFKEKPFIIKGCDVREMKQGIKICRILLDEGIGKASITDLEMLVASLYETPYTMIDFKRQQTLTFIPEMINQEIMIAVKELAEKWRYDIGIYNKRCRQLKDEERSLSEIIKYCMEEGEKCE